MCGTYVAYLANLRVKDVSSHCKWANELCWRGNRGRHVPLFGTVPGQVHTHKYDQISRRRSILVLSSLINDEYCKEISGRYPDAWRKYEWYWNYRYMYMLRRSIFSTKLENQQTCRDRKLLELCAHLGFRHGLVGNVGLPYERHFELAKHLRVDQTSKDIIHTEWNSTPETMTWPVVHWKEVLNAKRLGWGWCFKSAKSQLAVVDKNISIVRTKLKSEPRESDIAGGESERSVLNIPTSLRSGPQGSVNFSHHQPSKTARVTLHELERGWWEPLTKSEGGMTCNRCQLL